MPNPLGVNSFALAYDQANRLISAYNPITTNETYAYNAANQRIRKTINNTAEYYLYGIDGVLLGTYTLSGSTFQRKQTRYWFGSRLLRIRTEGAPAVEESILTDRLGSVVWRGGTRSKYAPYGEERNITAQGKEKFATYYRDDTTLDYALNRYYSSQQARFLTPDPYGDNWDILSPSSWNAYGYSNGDPANSNDPDGLSCRHVALEGWAGIAAGTTVEQFLSQNSDLSVFAKTVFTEARVGWDEMAAYEKAAISAVIMNRWQIVNGNYDLYSSSRGFGLVRTVPDWGKADGSVKSIVYAPGPQFQVWASAGVLRHDAQQTLTTAQNSLETGDLCASLLQSIGTVAGFWSARDQQTLYASAGNLVFTSFGSGPGEANRSSYEKTIGSFDSANVFYGVSYYQLLPHEIPIERGREPSIRRPQSGRPGR